VDYSKGAPNECDLFNSVPEKRIALINRASSEKCQIVGGINLSRERLQAGRSSGQLAKSHCPYAAVESPFFESPGAATGWLIGVALSVASLMGFASCSWMAARYSDWSYLALAVMFLFAAIGVIGSRLRVKKR
jgi:hypothetical protein